MSKTLSGLKLFLADLKRRRVYNVAVVYAVVAFVIWQAAEIAFPALQLPSWTLTFVVVTAFLGFPIALVLAWAFELTPKGVRRTEPLAGESELRQAPPADRPAAKLRSIAVLPFTDMSPEKDQEYFCDGMAEELIASLSRVPKLRIVARTSSFAFKGQGEDVRSIGEQLGVDAVLEGSVRKAGNRLRITAQLIEVGNGFHLWSERYDRELEDVFQIQEDIARGIANRFRGEVSAEEDLVYKRHSNNLEAYNLYLQGRYAWNRREADLTKASDYFGRAIEEDPDYSLAYAGLADCYNLFGWYGYLSPAESYPKAKELAEMAISKDDTLAEGYTSLGFAKMLYEWNWKEAEHNFLRAMELNPRYPTNRHWYSEYLMAVGRIEEAVAEAKMAQALDPLGLIINTVLAMAFYFARKYNEAIHELNKILETDSDFVPAQIWLGLAYIEVGKGDRAVELLRRTRELALDRPSVVALLGFANAASGNIQQASYVLNELRELSKQRYVSAFDLARIHIGLGETDRAVEMLASAERERSTSLTWARVDPTLDPLRGDFAFRELLRRMDLPD